jgi:hypothetical protein
MSTLKVLAICGSLRRASTNMGLLRYAKAHAPAGIQIEIADLSRSRSTTPTSPTNRPPCNNCWLNWHRLTPCCWPARNTTTPWPRR